MGCATGYRCDSVWSLWILCVMWVAAVPRGTTLSTMHCPQNWLEVNRTQAVSQFNTSVAKLQRLNMVATVH